MEPPRVWMCVELDGTPDLRVTYSQLTVRKTDHLAIKNKFSLSSSLCYAERAKKMTINKLTDSSSYLDKINSSITGDARSNCILLICS